MTTAYRGLLRREPDPIGLAHYVDLMASGALSRAEFLQVIAESSEAASYLMRAPGLAQYVRDVLAARPPGETAPRPILFLHILKTGGSSLTERLASMAGRWPILLNIYINELVCLPQALLQQAVVVTGHLPPEAAHLLHPDTAKLTVLREPVARTLSHLAHLRRNGHPTLTPEAFVFEDEWRHVWQNHQARHLATDAPVFDVWRGALADANLQYLMVHSTTTMDLGTIRERAHRRLASTELVGITEDLPAVLRRVAAIWEMPAPCIGQANVSEDRVDRHELPDRVVREIESGTALDAELHEHARAATTSDSTQAYQLRSGHP